MKTNQIVTGYFDVRLQQTGPTVRNNPPGRASLTAQFKLDSDISSLFPFINAVADRAVLFKTPPFVRFVLDNILCALYPDDGAAAPFEDYNGACAFLDRLVVFLNDLHRRRKSIVPNFKTFKPVSVLDIYKLLPKTNCGECGYATCLAFAAGLSKSETLPDRCPGFRRPISENAVYPILDNEGNLVSTLTLDIDTAGFMNEFKGQQKQIEALEKELASISQADASAPVATPPLPSPLTGREQQVLKLIAGGATNTEISERLQISPHTVKSHVINIFNKLGVNDRTQAAVWAARHGLI